MTSAAWRQPSRWYAKSTLDLPMMGRSRLSFIAAVSACIPDSIMTDLSSPTASPAATAELDIGGMSCASCVRRVEKALARVPGVTDVSVNLATERASIGIAAATPATIDSLVEAVARAGYEARPVAAPRVSGRDSSAAASVPDADLDPDAERQRQSQRELGAPEVGLVTKVGAPDVLVMTQLTP